MKSKIQLIFLFLSISLLFSKQNQFKIKLEHGKLVPEKFFDQKLDLVNISKLNPRIIIDIRYATNDNAFGKAMYKSGKCYLRREIAQQINEVQKELEQSGLGLKIWDGFRPVLAQEAGFKIAPRFFAKPNKERMKHPRGTAVDLTIVDKNGNELDMGTEFDDFTQKASRNFRSGLSQEALENRETLESIMVKYGFIPLAHEWWHFDYYKWKSYEIIYKDFDEIE